MDCSTRPLYPSLSPGVCSNSCPLSQWCYLAILSYAALFSFWLQSFPDSFQHQSLFYSAHLDTEQERTAPGRRKRVIRRQWCLRIWRRWEIPGGRANWWNGQRLGYSSWSATTVDMWVATNWSKWCGFRNKDKRKPVQKLSQHVSPIFPCPHHPFSPDSAPNAQLWPWPFLDTLHYCWVKSRAGFTLTLPAFPLPPLVSQHPASIQTCTLSLHTCCSLDLKPFPCSSPLCNPLPYAESKSYLQIVLEFYLTSWVNLEDI